MRNDPLDRPVNDDDAAPQFVDIDAFLDGEPVDRRTLRSALEDPAACDYLIEALFLRQITRDMGPARFAIPGTPRAAIVRRLRWVAAGLMVAVSAGAGYAYGKGSGIDDRASGHIEVVLDTRPAPAAPEPTRTIRFEPGVNWSAGERSR